MQRLKRETEHIYVWQPGNGSSYRLCMRKVEVDQSLHPKWMVTWLRYGDTAGPSLIVRVPGVLYASYVAEKMGVDIAEAVAFCIFLRDQFRFEVEIPSNFHQQTGLWHGQKHGDQPTKE